MYERHFGFSVKPFCLTPDPAFLYSSPRHAKALSILEYGLESQAPFSLLTGEIGSGKTLLVGSLLRKFADQLVVGLVNNSHGHFSSIGGWVASALGLSPRDKSDIAIYEAMVESFVHHYANGRRTLLVFDEAQNLSVEILEELRLLSNVNSERDLVLQILLVGQPELRAKLNRPELKQFAQRVSVHFHLTSLEKDETHVYIRHRLRVAGGNPALFSPEAIDLIHTRANGVPRLVNQLCDFALVHAYAEERIEIDADLVTQALNDSRSGFALLPVPDAEAAPPGLTTNGSGRSRAPVIPVASDSAAAEEETPANHNLKIFEALRLARERALVAKLGPRVAQMKHKVSPAKPQITRAEPQVARAEPQVARAEPQVARAEPQVARAEPQVARAEPQVARAEPQVARAEPQVARAEPPVVRAEPAVVHAEPAVVHAEPAVVHAEAPVAHVEPPVAHVEPQVALAEPQQSDLSTSTVSDGSEEITDVVAPWNRVVETKIEELAARDREAAVTADEVWRRNQKAMASAVPLFKQESRFRRALPVAAMVAVAIAGVAWWRLYESKHTSAVGKPQIAATQTAAKSVAAAPAVTSSTAASPASVSSKDASTSSPSVAVASPTVASATAGPPALAKPTVPYLMWAARAAFSDKRQQLPRTDGDLRGDSALELYNLVLVQEPSNEEALDGIRHLLAVGNARIQSDLSGGKFEDAARIANLLQAGVEPNSMRDIKANIAAARPKWFATRARASLAAGDLAGAEQLLSQATAAGATPKDIAEIRKTADAVKLQRQLSSMADQVKAAIDSGALLDPATDNANTRLRAMLSISRTDPLTLHEQRDLQAALLARAQDATHKDQFELAQRFITAAANARPSIEVNSAQQQLRGEIDRAAQRTAVATAEATNAKEPLSASAAISEPKYIAARPTSPLAVVYPNNAADLSVQGFVTVEFTIRPDGKASDVTVVDSRPRGVFENAAITAVRNGHFDTKEVADHQTQRARLKLSFKAAS
jgi:general secretion pathway protein A